MPRLGNAPACRAMCTLPRFPGCGIGRSNMARTPVAKKKATRTATRKPVAVPAEKARPAPRKTSKPKAAPAVMTTLPAAMTGRASPAKAKDGDEPVFAYFRSLPQPQRGIAEHVDALAANTLPGLQRAVKWGIAWAMAGASAVADLPAT